MGNLSALTPITTTATALSNLVLVSPQSVVGYSPQVNGILTNIPSSTQIPKLPVPNGFLSQSQPTMVFDYEGEQIAALQSDITDHFIETNVAVQDQIALKPVEFTTHGFIGELNDIAPSFLQPLQAVADKLTVIGAYTPQLSATALIAYNTAFQLYQVANNAYNSAVNSYSALSNAFTNNANASGETVIGNSGLTYVGNQTKQQTAFQQFYAYWSNRILFTVQTPWAVFQNMAIKTLRAIQDAETAVITDFEITFKQIRTVSSSDALGNQIFQNRSANQSASNVNLANTSLGASTDLTTLLPGAPSSGAVP